MCPPPSKFAIARRVGRSKEAGSSSGGRSPIHSERGFSPDDHLHQRLALHPSHLAGCRPPLIIPIRCGLLPEKILNFLMQQPPPRHNAEEPQTPEFYRTCQG